MTAIDTQKFVRKPLYVAAVRISTANFNQIREWCQGEVEYEPAEAQEPANTNGKKYIRVRVHNPKNPRQTKAFVGDWLLYTERGYKVYTNKAFRASFDKVLSEPEGEENVKDEFPMFYIDPETGFLTEEKPHEEAHALRFEELMDIIKKEIVSERHYARIEAANTGRPDPITPTPYVEVGEVSSPEEPQNQDEQMPSEPARVVDTDTDPAPSSQPIPATIESVQQPAIPSDKGVVVLSRQDQAEMDADEIRGLVQSGEAILAQDLES